MADSTFNTDSDRLQAQYERWVYPPRAYDLGLLPLAAPPFPYQDLRNLFWLYWPKAAQRDDLDILVAGCGSLSAAAYAHLYPRSRVVGIDISHAALEHSEFLKTKHNLANLILRHARMEDATTLGADFDFIVCHEVLSHVAEPAAGLRALGQVLRQDGVIDVQVHGKYGRAGVTLLQELFRLMGVKQDSAGLLVVRDVLRALPPNHPVQHYRKLAEQDLATDEGLVHTFLHRRDRPFSCGECLDLVQEAGLVFQGWKESGLYELDTRLAPQDPLRPHLDELSQRQRWQAAEMLDAKMVRHWFHVCRPDRDPANYRVQFDDSEFLSYLPVTRLSQSVPADRLRRQPAMIARPPFPPMYLDDQQAAVFRQIDGHRNVGECLAAAGLSGEPAITLGRRFFSALWRAGYAMFRLPGITG